MKKQYETPYLKNNESESMGEVAVGAVVLQVAPVYAPNPAVVVMPMPIVTPMPTYIVV